MVKRLVFVTAGAANEPSVRFVTTTGAPVLPKPFDFNALCRVVGEIAGHDGRMDSEGGGSEHL